MAHDAGHTGGHARGFHGPLAWAAALAAGLLIGAILAFAVPPARPGPGHHDDAHADTVRVYEIRPDGSRILTRGPGDQDEPADIHAPDKAHPHIPLWLCAPFALLLLSIALMPFVSASFWGRHYPDFAFFFGGIVVAYYLAAFGAAGRHEMVHLALEYYAFIALVVGLYVVSGSIVVRVHGRAGPALNTLLFAVGTVLANLVGTTGASVLLVRPFMRLNAGRLRPIHIVFFIFIVSNCAGALTPIGDPPLYLGYLRGVPFTWTLRNLWPMWLVVNGVLLALFYAVDTLISRRDRAAGRAYEPTGGARPSVGLEGRLGLACLAVMIAAVFVDPLLAAYAGIRGVPVGPTIQVVTALVAWSRTPRHIHEANDFHLHPAKEVGLLFVGIFATMAPALGYLAANGARLGLESPTQFYFFTGALSAFLDNAPTYLNFLQTAFGMLDLELTPPNIRDAIASEFLVVHPDGTELAMHGRLLLEAISLGAVFFGAMTYIGNGPNFMVKAIAESQGVRMPSFFGYLLLAVLILLPVLLLNWAIFIR